MQGAIAAKRMLIFEIGSTRVFEIGESEMAEKTDDSAEVSGAAAEPVGAVEAEPAEDLEQQQGEADMATEAAPVEPTEADHRAALLSGLQARIHEANAAVTVAQDALTAALAIKAEAQMAYDTAQAQA